MKLMSFSVIYISLRVVTHMLEWTSNLQVKVASKISLSFAHFSLLHCHYSLMIFSPLREKSIFERFYLIFRGSVVSAPARCPTATPT